jgi:hypothetical protein
MRARDVNANGPLVITNPPDAPVVSSVSAKGNNLSGIVSSSGDFKNPRPQSYTKSTFSNLFGNAITSIFGTIYSTEGFFRPAAGTIHIVDGNAADLAALENLYEQIRGSVDLSIDLYQIKQTQRTVVKAIRLVTQMRSSLKAMIKSKPRDWGGQWLEYVYGVKPTLSTIFESLEKIKKPETVWYDIRARASSRDKRTDTVSIELPGIPFLAVRESSNRVEYRCKFAMSNSALESLAGFSSLNPVSFAWEALPYSFVVDWFVNVGGYLRATESALLYNQAFVSGYRTSVVRSRTGSILKGMYSPFDGFFYLYNGAGETTLTNKVRTILLSAPMPDVPRFKVDLGSGRLLNAAALLSQLLK